MATESFEVFRIIPATPKRIYRAWLDSKEHSAFTGGKAEVDARVDGRFSAWDGYIEGHNLELEPELRIVQAWRTSEFPAESAHSRLEIQLEPAPGGTRVLLIHSGIPEGQGARYHRGWVDHYLEPMTAFFTASKSKPASVRKQPKRTTLKRTTAKRTTTRPRPAQRAVVERIAKTAKPAKPAAKKPTRSAKQRR